MSDLVDALECAAQEAVLKADSFSLYADLLRSGRLGPDQVRRVRQLLRRLESLHADMVDFNSSLPEVKG